MVSSLLIVLCLLYIIWFYIHRGKKIKELKQAYPPYSIDSSGNAHYYIRAWHYIKNKKILRLYNNPTQVLIPLVKNGSFVKRGNNVVEIKGDINYGGKHANNKSVCVPCFSDGFFYCTNIVFSPSNPLVDGTELFVLEKERRPSEEEIRQGRIASWPEPVESSGNEVILSSRLFGDEEKGSIDHATCFTFRSQPNVTNMCHVDAGQPLGEIIEYRPRIITTSDSRYHISISAHKEGYIFIPNNSVKVNGCVARIYDSLDECIEKEYSLAYNVSVETDEFTSLSVISAVVPFLIGNKCWCTFTCTNNIASLKILFETKELSISRGDCIDFLFSQSKLHFDIIKSPVRSADDSKRRVCEIILSQADIAVFCNESLLKIRISSSEQDVVTLPNLSIRYPEIVCEYYIRKIAKAFSEKLLTLEIELVTTEASLETEKDSSCFVYIMKDESNGAHKIGISNKPEYREKTLQSDKPYIVLLQAKEFPSRTIARAFESALHKTYESKHLRGEWFDLSEDEVKEVIQSLK